MNPPKISRHALPAYVFETDSVTVLPGEDTQQEPQGEALGPGLSLRFIVGHLSRTNACRVV